MANLFVYGTLKRGHCAHSLMEQVGATFVRPAITSQDYSLLNVNGAFPGMVEQPSEHGVSGELYDLDPESMGPLDLYEGVAHGLFRQGEVTLDDGTKATAYLFNRQAAMAKVVPSGVWE